MRHLLSCHFLKLHVKCLVNQVIVKVINNLLNYLGSILEKQLVRSVNNCRPSAPSVLLGKVIERIEKQFQSSDYPF